VVGPTARSSTGGHRGSRPHRRDRRGADPGRVLRRRAAGRPSRGGRELPHQPRPQRPRESASDPRL